MTKQKRAPLGPFFFTSSRGGEADEAISRLLRVACSERSVAARNDGDAGARRASARRRPKRLSDGELYVFYTAAGEDALGLLHLELGKSGITLFSYRIVTTPVMLRNNFSRSHDCHPAAE